VPAPSGDKTVWVDDPAASAGPLERALAARKQPITIKPQIATPIRSIENRAPWPLVDSAMVAIFPAPQFLPVTDL
jgi:hypothetical protein